MKTVSTARQLQQSNIQPSTTEKGNAMLLEKVKAGKDKWQVSMWPEILWQFSGQLGQK